MKKLLSIITVGALCLTCFACAAPKVAPVATASADVAAVEKNSLERVQEKGVFIVGLDDSFPPMGFRDKDNELVGFDIDLARAVAEKMGLKVEFLPVIWDNIALEIKNRNVDVIWNGCTITDARKEVFNFSGAYMLNKQAVIVLNDSPYITLADLTGKIAGLQDGSSANIALDSHKEFKDSLSAVQGYPTNDKALLDLAAKRLDCVIVDTSVYGHYAQIKPDTYRMLEQDLGSEEFGIAFHKDDKEFMDALQVALDEVIKSPEGLEISNKWFNTSVFPS